MGCHFLLQGIEPASLALADRFSTTESPGKPQALLLKHLRLSHFFCNLFFLLPLLLRLSLILSLLTFPFGTPLFSWPQIPKIRWWFTLFISGTLELNIQYLLLDIFCYHYSFPASGTPSSLLFLSCFPFTNCLMDTATDNLYTSFGLMWYLLLEPFFFF